MNNLIDYCTFAAWKHVGVSVVPDRQEPSSAKKVVRRDHNFGSAGNTCHFTSPSGCSLSESLYHGGVQVVRLL